MEQYGFFGGAFNPPTYAHIELAKEVVKKLELDKLFFVPVGNQYKKVGLEAEEHRYAMLQEVCKKEEKLKVSDIELGKKHSYTAIDVFEMVQKQYSTSKNYFIMGSDNLAKLPTWTRAEELISNFHYIILNRIPKQAEEVINRIPLLEKNKEHFIILDNEVKPISSTQARDYIKQKKQIEHWIPKVVEEYIKRNHLYQEEKQKK